MAELQADHRRAFRFQLVGHWNRDWTFLPIFNDKTGTYGCFAFPPGGAVYFFDRDITKKLPCVSAGLP